MTMLEHIKVLSRNLSAEEREKLVEYLLRDSNEEIKRETKSLHGSWKGKFPEDFDIDAALKEIRSEWEEELDLECPAD